MGKSNIQLHEDRRIKAKMFFDTVIKSRLCTVDALLVKIEQQINDPSIGIEGVKKDLNQLQALMEEYGIFHATYDFVDKYHECVVERVKNLLNKINCQQIGGYRYATTKGREMVDAEKVEQSFTTIKEIVEKIAVLSKEDVVKKLTEILQNGYKKTTADSKRLSEVSETFTVFDI